MKKLIGLAAVAVVLLACQSLIMAQGCTSIAQPTTAYTTDTRACLLSNPNDCAVGGVAVARWFDPLSIRALGAGWATWGPAPFTEGAIPGMQIGFNQADVATLYLFQPATTTGLEVEPNLFAQFQGTVQFYTLVGDTAQLVHTITQTIDGQSGARLFAATCSQPITHIRVTVPGAQGFGMARLRSNAFPAGAEDDVDEPLANPVPVDVPEGTTSNAEIIIE